MMAGTQSHDHDSLPNNGRPFEYLRTDGLLWLINKTVFHPRGYALALNINAHGEATGWDLLGDGTEPWTFGDMPDGTPIDDDGFRRAEAFLASLRQGDGT